MLRQVPSDKERPNRDVTKTTVTKVSSKSDSDVKKGKYVHQAAKSDSTEIEEVDEGWAIELLEELEREEAESEKQTKS